MKKDIAVIFAALLLAVLCYNQLNKSEFVRDAMNGKV